MTVDTAPRLTPRQRLMLAKIADGDANRQIADDLFIEVNSVKTHVRALYKRLGARDRAHAVSLGYQHGFLGAGVAFEERLTTVRLILGRYAPSRSAAPEGSRFASLYDAVCAAVTDDREGQ